MLASGAFSGFVESMAKKDDDGRKVVAENRRARFEYFIEDTWEAGFR